MDHSVIMKLTGPKTAAMFHCYNTLDTADALEYQKFEGVLGPGAGGGNFWQIMLWGKKVLP